MKRILVSFFIFMCATVYAQPPESKHLIVANSKAWKPFSFINSDGEPDGILIDYWNYYGEKNGVEIEFLLLDWQSSLDAVSDGRADIHAGLLWSENRESFLDYAPIIMSIDTQLYISQELIGIDLDEFTFGKHDYVVGVVSGGYEEEFTRLHFPELKLQNFANNQEMIDAAFSGGIDGFVADLQVANFYLYSRKEPKRFVGVRHLYSGDLMAAVKEGNSALQKQITEAMNQLDTKDTEKIFNRWMYVNTVYPEYLTHLIVGGILLVCGTYIFVLRISVKRKTHALEQANKKLKKLSETDQMTGISNRRHFFIELKERLKQPGSIVVMIFDIDDFKNINDSHGHKAGDRVIRSVVCATSNVVSHRHLFARIGGEEFAVVANNLSYEGAVALAENICTSIRGLKLVEDNVEKVTVSLGCAFYTTNEYDINLSTADHLMYQSKQSGKDKVTAQRYS
ncbi:diguanylate cyclase [Vibrio xuii]|nr:diguanylate cyclase [Vibrio xuii]